MVTENVHNYYETELQHLLRGDTRFRGKDEDYVEDVICLTLNQLPAFYVRFNVDATFYMSDEEAYQVRNKLKNALDRAIEKVESSPAERD